MNNKSTIEIRKAKIEDVSQIAEVHSVSAYKAYKDIMSKEILEGFWNQGTLKEDWSNYITEAKDNKDLFAYVAVDNEEVIGILRANFANEHDRDIFKDVGAEEHMKDYVHFKTIYIHPDHQGRSIGRMFMDHVAKDALKKGKSKLMTITTDRYEDSPRFFKSFGAKFAGRHDVDMKEHYDTTTSSVEDSKLITNVWFMNAEEVIDISAKKQERYKQEKVSRINSIIANRSKFFEGITANTNKERAVPIAVIAMHNSKKFR